MPRILISYRHSDSLAIAGRIFDRLAAYYGRESIFQDIENIPFGTHIRKHIETTLQTIDLMLVLIGPGWIGPTPRGEAKIAHANDLVRLEVETALVRGMPVIPLLVDGAKMPASTDLPESLRDFVFLNAPEISSGRDFHSHMDRVIETIERAFPGGSRTRGSLATSINARPRHAAVPRNNEALTAPTGKTVWVYPMGYLGLPVLILLIVHHLIVNSFNLDSGYLRAASFVVPSCFGFLLSWRERTSFRAAVLLGAVVGIVAVTGMTVSESLNSGDPILPSTIYEWRENIEYAVTIGLCFIGAHMVAHVLRARMARTSKLPS